ncbi:hypothetical protein N9Y17_04225 [Gammaproteobacteria bacterium]|nr:hypothetical protein [Gammaproteobacteria bacterium]
MQMTSDQVFICEVGYCGYKDTAYLFSVKLDQGTTIQSLLTMILSDLPKFDWHISRLGHRYTPLDTILREGDRIYLSPKLCQGDNQKRRTIRSKKVD